MPRRHHRTSTSQTTGPDTRSESGDRSSDLLSNYRLQSVLRSETSGDASGDTASTTHDEWGAAIEAESEVLAPYQSEIAEGQVAQPGQRDGVVPWLQGALQGLGYPTPSSRTFDGPTVAALQEWQRLNGGAVTGVFGPDELSLMQRALEASISLVEFKENAPGIAESTLAEYLPHLNASMLKANITTDTRKAVYIAQLGHESDGFNTLEEYASGQQYEGREDLGNIHPGDGRRFKGRGPIQITGRDNYESYGAAIGVDIAANPDIAATPEVGFQLAAEYWNRNDLNRFSDRGQFNTVTQRINGGQNGKADRRNRWSRAQRVLRKWEDTPDVVPTPVARPDGIGPDAEPTWRDGQADAVLTQLANGDDAGALQQAGELADRAHAEGEDPAPSSLARDAARALLDAQTAMEEARYEDAKGSAHDAARVTRYLRDNDMASGNLTDPVIARAGELWTRANEAAKAASNQGDIALLEAALPMRRGARGDAVAALQRLLGMDAGGGAGIFGPATERAVKEFQSRHGLGSDGVVGGGTLDKLRG